jgi:pimeloyl-ACP methyl ester carboxylesterase
MERIRRAIFSSLLAVACIATSVSCVTTNVGVAQETRIAPVGDAEIEYVISGPEEGEPILLIHGALLGTALALVQNHLQQLGYRVIRIHRRGFVGSSDDAPPLSASGHAADAVAVLDDLGLDAAHVAGHSMGAGIALLVLLESPERVRSVTMIDPAAMPGLYSTTPDAIQAELFGQAMAAFQAGDAEAGIESFSRAVLGKDWRESFFDAITDGYETALRDARRLVLGAPPPPVIDPAQVAAAGRPIRVLWAGEHEGSAAAAELADSLPEAEVGFIDGTDHALITQKPAEVAADISAFVARMSN